MKKSEKKLTKRQQLIALVDIAKLIFISSPIYVVIEIINMIVSSIMPLLTTFFAASTTTALAEAYNGNEAAGRMAIIYMFATAIASIAMATWNTARSYFERKSQYKIDTRIQNRLYEKFLSLEFCHYDDKKIADLFEKSIRFSDSFVYIFNSILELVSQAIIVFSSLIALFFVGWWLCLLVLVAIIPDLLIQIKISRMQIKHWKENVGTRRSAWNIEKTLRDVNLIAELKIYGVVKHLLNLFKQLRSKDEEFGIDFERKYMTKKIAANILESAVELIALVYTTFRIIAHELAVGQFLYVQQVVSRAFDSSRTFFLRINAIDEDLSNLFDYQEFMNLPTDSQRANQLTSVPKSINLKNVSFCYPNSQTMVLKNISFGIKNGQHVAIVGENGAGKSTLIKLILGLYNPQTGKIFLDDIDLATIDLKTWHQYLGVLQQEFIRYNFATARENIYLGDINHKPSQARLERAIDLAEAREFLEKLSNGLDTYVDKWIAGDDDVAGTELSGGQWQRLALARNFYRNSPIIILDEPTSAIDALAEAKIFKNLLSDKQRTVITISHRLTTVEKADIIYMIENGEIVERGSHKELVALNGKYFSMFEAQMHDSDKVR